MAFKKAITVAAVAALAATAAVAQDNRPRQVEVQGETGNPDYPRFVLATDNVVYFCEEGTRVVNGETVRACILGNTPPPAAGVPIVPTAVGTNAVLAAGAGGVILAVANRNSGSSNNTPSTPGTTSGTN